MVDFVTKKTSNTVLNQIEQALKKIKGGYGSVEIIVQNHCITQISTREIVKTNEPIEKGVVGVINNI